MSRLSRVWNLHRCQILFRYALSSCSGNSAIALSSSRRITALSWGKAPVMGTVLDTW